MKLKDALKKDIPKKLHDSVPSSFDVVGDIAIVEITDSMIPYEKKIGEKLLSLHKNIHVVVKKHGIHGGTYRLQKYRILAGERRKTTVHKENGIRLKLHIEQTYFSGRSATERLRIANLVKKGERVLVMFGGVAPFALVMAKNTSAKEIISIELNPKASVFAEENVRLNKASNVTALNGDVRDVVPTLGKFDRVVMPLPKDAEKFLDVALGAIKKGGMIHLYHFGTMEESDLTRSEIKKGCKDVSRKCLLAPVVKCGQFSPGTYRLCSDIKVDTA